jgi:hypothetical protein
MTPLGLIYIAVATLYVFLVKGLIQSVFDRTSDRSPLGRALPRATAFAIFFGFGALAVEGFGLPVPSLLALLISPWWGHGMLELNIKSLAVSWVVYLIIFIIRELYVERRDAVSNRRYTGGPSKRKKRSLELGHVLAILSILIILVFAGILLAMFGVDFVIYIASVAAVILVGSIFVAWFRRLRRGKYRITVDTPGLVCFETDFGEFQVNTAHSSFRFDGENVGSWQLADIRHLEFEATQRWSLIAEFLLGWNPTDVVEKYRDRLEYYAIYIRTTDGRYLPLYIASQLRPREFLMGWYIRFQEEILERLGLFKNGYRHSRSVYLNLVKIFRAAGVPLPDADTALPYNPPTDLPKIQQ